MHFDKKAPPSIQGTPEKLRFSVRSGLRPPVDPELAGYVSPVLSITKGNSNATICRHK